MSAPLIDRLPVFMRDAILQHDVDTSDDGAVQELADLIMDRMVDEVCATAGMPSGVVASFRATEEEVLLKLRGRGWFLSAVPYSRPDEYTELQFCGLLASLIRAMQRDTDALRTCTTSHAPLSPSRERAGLLLRRSRR